MEAAGQAPKVKPGGAGKAAWAAMAREGECIESEHLLDKLPELAEHPEPHALVARLKQKGVEASAEDVAGGRMVKVAVPSRYVGMFFVPRSLCREFLDMEKL